MTTQQEVVKPTMPMAGKLIVGSFLVGLLASMHSAPRVMKMFGESQADIARVHINRLAYEAFPQWKREHIGCPHSIDELGAYMDARTTVDPWGHRYRMVCQGHAAVFSCRTARMASR